MGQVSVSGQEVYIADSDLAFRSAVASGLETAGYRVTSFSDGPSLLAAMRSRAPDCLLIDLNVKGNSQSDLLGDLGSRVATPIVTMADDPNVELAVSAMKKGACDFVSKPCAADSIVGRIKQVIDDHQGEPSSKADLTNFRGGDRLTPRERDVLKKIALGASNKEAGRQLGISPRTVEVHRARIMEKIGARNTADLVRIVYSASL
jgi:two-component system, LuxR family, response regulator FixJ